MAEDGGRAWLRFVGRATALATSIGVPFALLVSCGALGGAWLDKRHGTGPWMTLGGVVLASVLAFANMLRVLGVMERDAGQGDMGSDRDGEQQ